MNKILLVFLGIVILIVIAVMMIKPSPGTLLPSSTNKTPQTPTKNPTINTTIMKKDNTITETQAGFVPSNLRIKVGNKVFWENKSGAMGNVSSSKHPTHRDYTPLNLGNFDNEGSVQLIFEKPGTYTYHDHLNSSRIGTIIVE